MLIEHKPLQDPVVVNELFRILLDLSDRDVDFEHWDTAFHVSIFKNWITGGHTTNIVGLDGFENAALCAGTSAAISCYIQRHQNRRMRFSRAEFVLSKIICNNIGCNWKFIEDGCIESNDAVIMSLPFSGNGSVYPGFEQLLIRCSELEIPICLDLAYIGIAHDLTIDLTAPSITDVTTSLSKPFSTMLRHGIRFTKHKVDDQVQYASDRSILPRIDTVIASRLMQKFSKDYIVTKYLPRYRSVCNDLGLQETNTVTLALGNNLFHDKFFRGGYHRICVTDEILTQFKSENKQWQNAEKNMAKIGDQNEAV